MNAVAVKDSVYLQIKQRLSGYHLGYERKDCWRVRVLIGRRFYLSSETYETEEGAKRAAKRLSERSPS